MQQYPELKRNINNRDFYEPAVEEEGARRGILPSIEVDYQSAPDPTCITGA
jgi:hypothetical protein